MPELKQASSQTTKTRNVTSPDFRGLEASQPMGGACAGVQVQKCAMPPASYEFNMTQSLRFTSLALFVALSAGAAPAWAQAARTLTGEAVEGSKSPFRGSTLSYQHGGTAISFYKAAEPTWNPYYAHELTLRPEWHFADEIFLRARVTLSQELTNSDSSKYENEFLLSDTALELVWAGWTEDNSKIRVSGNLRGLIPTSKAAWGQSLVTSVSPALTLTRAFPVLGGFIVGYSGRVTRNFNRWTTSQYDGPTLPCGDMDSPACSRFVHSGVRNTAWSLSHGPIAILVPTEKLTLTFAASFFRSQLYDLNETVVETATGSIDLGEGSGVNARYATLMSLDANWQFNEVFALSGGVFSFAGQTGADGQYRNPFVNRFTSFYVDVIVDLERAWAAVRGPRK